MIPATEILKLTEDVKPENGPILGYMPDWRDLHSSSMSLFTQNNTESASEEDKPKCFIRRYFLKMKGFVERNRGQLYPIHPNGKGEDYKDKIDGLIIPGGRDIDPELYGEKNEGSDFDKAASKRR